jgi:sugar/nucleoside kinase (ribokinase family)
VLGLPKRAARRAERVLGLPKCAARRAERVLVLGDVLTDVVVRAAGAPTHGGDTRAAIDVRPGGSGANQAAWLAAHGSAVDVVGRIGRDPLGQLNADDLRRRGVRTHLTRDEAHATGMVVVLVSPDGERTMLTDRGASRHLDTPDVPAELFQPGTHFHLSGYVLLDAPSRPAALHALALARQAGLSVSVDPVASTLIREAGAERFWSGRAALRCVCRISTRRVRWSATAHPRRWRRD